MMMKIIFFIFVATSFKTFSAAQNTIDRKRLVCYFANWSIYRRVNPFSASNIIPNLCTHIHYAYATLEKDVGIVPFNPKVDIQLDGYKKFIEIKSANMKVLLSVGGTKEGSIRFSNIAADPEMRCQFVKNGALFLKMYKFDGLDLVWQYPAYGEGSRPVDKQNYLTLVKELREEFDRIAYETGEPKLILSMAVPALEAFLDPGFDLVNLTKYLDYFNVIAYDYHSPQDPVVNHVAPLYSLPGETTNKDLNAHTTVKNYLRRGVDPKKMNLGIPAYGTSYTLQDREMTDIGSPTDGEGSGSEPGFLPYHEICKKIMLENWAVKHVNKSAMGPYAYKDKKWISYDDRSSVREKTMYAIKNNLGGVMFWTIDNDDFQGECHNRLFPLIKEARDVIAEYEDSSSYSGGVTTQSTAPTKATPTVRLPTNNENKKPTTAESIRVKPTLEVPNKNDKPTNDQIEESETYPELEKFKSINNKGDVIFQNIKIWITNNYFPPPS